MHTNPSFSSHGQSKAQTLAFGLLLLLAFTFPFEKMLVVLPVGGRLTITTVEVLYILALSTWIGGHCVTRRWPSVPTPLRWPVALWLVVLALSAAQAPAHRGDAWKFTVRMVEGALIGYMTYDLVDDARRWKWVARGLAMGGMMVALIGLAELAGWQPAVAWTLQFRPHPTRVGDVIRLTSVLVYATIASMVLELTIPLALAWVLTAYGRAVRGTRISRRSVLPFLGVLIPTAGLVAGIAAQVLTLSRAGIIALTGAYLLTALPAWRRERVWVYGTVVAFLMMVSTVVVAYVVQPVVALRLISETERYWYQAEYTVTEEIQARPGETVVVPVRVRNVGLRSWSPDGDYPFALSYHLYYDNGSPLTYEGVRTPLPHTVRPGQTVSLDARVVAPPEPGRYIIAWDMVQQAVTWFSWKGNKTPRTHVRVAGPPVARPELPPAPPPSDVRLVVPTPGRLTLWRTAWRMFRSRPLLGVGPDNFRLLYGPYAGVDRWDMGIHANNLYLEWLADTGVLGLGAFLWFMVALGGVLRTRWKAATTREERLWRLGIIAALAAWFFHGGLDYFYEFMPTLVPFWMLVGLAAQRWQGQGS